MFCRRTRLLVCSLSICLRYTSTQKSLHMNLIISRESVNRGRSLVYRSTRRWPTAKPTDSTLRLACCSCELDGLLSKSPSAMRTSSICRYEKHDSATWERAAAMGIYARAAGRAAATRVRRCLDRARAPLPYVSVVPCVCGAFPATALLCPTLCVPDPPAATLCHTRGRSDPRTSPSPP